MFMVRPQDHVLLWLNEGNDKALGLVEPQDGRGLGPGFMEGIAACSTDYYKNEKLPLCSGHHLSFLHLSCGLSSIPSKRT